MRRILITFLLSIVCIVTANSENNVKYNGSCLIINGNETFVYSAAFHYFRTPKELWRDRFTKIKAAGFNTVETYIPWNISELNMPKSINDYSQCNFDDLKEWLHMAEDEFGFYTVVRPGAFICAEFAGGAYPRWLAKFRPANFEGFWLRSTDSRYLDWHDHWYNAVCKVIRQEQITSKPKGKKGIILTQIENEYDAHKIPNKVKALQRMYQTMRKNGVTIPIFTCLTSECRGSKDSILSQVFDCDNYYVGQKDAVSCARRMESLKQRQPNAPGFVTELQGGWFSTVLGTLSENHYSNDKHFYALAMMSVLGGATGIFPYVFVGGTHFAGWGARGMTTSYDYNAGIHENGALSVKYFAAKNFGKFIHLYGSKLIHSKGGICSFKDAPANVVGGVRIASDGTRFVFMHNSSTNTTVDGKTLVSSDNEQAKQTMYNIDQNENKVSINADNVDNGLNFKPFEIIYNLMPMETKVLIIPAKSKKDKGEWWGYHAPEMKSEQPEVVRIKEIKKYDEDAKTNWQSLPEGVSLPEIGVNDARYVLYRSVVTLDDTSKSAYSYILFNTFSRDIINLMINGKLAKRIYPSDKWASQVTRQRELSFTFLKDTEYDNKYDISGLLHQGRNEIIALYENIGHEHGYYPMEELCGIHVAGLSDNDSVIRKKLSWEVSTDLAGINHHFTSPEFIPDNWQTITLDTICDIPRKGNNIQPHGQQDALLTWYRADFTLPKDAKSKLWRLVINASGNGYIYVNGHNIGRHWEGGPQREYYIPECWLNKDKNSIVIGLRQTINGAVIKAMEIATYDNTRWNN